MLLLIVAFALLTAGLARFQLHLGFTPVPITGQTLGVLLAGGTLGWKAAGASQALYWVLGLTGLPFYSGGTGGWHAGTGATMGYFVGFVVCAAVVGYLTERPRGGNILAAMSAMALGSVVIYVFGAAWLAHSYGLPAATGDRSAISLGVTPFLIGDAIKLVVAGSLLPAAWALAGRA
jgi:biotin transport system substrate-specific component